MKKIIIILLIFSVKTNAQCFTVGADLSYANTVLANGGIYRDANNNIVNPYTLFAQKGANMARIRLFHTPENNTDFCGNPITSNDLNDVVLAFKSAKLQGMKLNLAIHYGDYFNDPSKQKRPKIWAGLTGTVLLDSIYNYTYSVLTRLQTESVTPDIVAIGNETTWGFIDDTSATDGWTWSEDTAKFNIAFKAVTDFNTTNATSIKKAVHFTDNTASWLAGLFASNNITNFDIIGLSYYPVWSNFTNLLQLGNLVNALKTTYNKEVMIFETGVPWTTANADGYSNIVNSYGNLSYPISPQGQKDFFNDLVTTVYNAGGTGVLYWEPDWISSNLCDLWGQGSSYENMSFFDFTNSNQPLPAFDVFNFCNNLSVQNNSIAKKISVFPNPAKNELKIIGLEKNTKITITDALGRNLKKIIFEKNAINISELPSGIYYLNFYIDNIKITKKVIKE